MHVNKNHGFTLVELIVAIGIASVVLLAISSFIVLILRWQLMYTARLEVAQQGMFVLNTIQRHMHTAASIVSPTSGATASVLELEMYESANDPTIFSLSSGVMYVQHGVSSSEVITNSRISVSSFEVQNISYANTPGAISLNFTLVYSSGDFEYSQTFYASAAIR